jgi:tetratricopeptide (TPR) repeat protein
VTDPNDPSLEQALLAEDWKGLLGLLDDVNAVTPSPVLRLIKGHACLAENRNNESSCLFRSVSSTEDKSIWLAWAESFSKQHPDSSGAIYLLGDALGRSEDYDRAINVLKQGIQGAQACPAPALRLNALGVFCALRGDLNEARDYFEQAVSSSGGQLADSYANLGMYWIQRSEGAIGAEGAFDEALRLSPDFALALHGRGCARLVNKKPTARKDLEDALAQSGCLEESMLENVVRCAAQVAGADVGLILAEARESGTTFERSYSMDKLAASANGWTSTAEAFGKATWLPFNQHFQKFCENRVVERMEGMEKIGGIDAVKEYVNTKSVNPSLATESVNRAGAFNGGKTQAVESGIKDIGGLAAIGGTLAKNPWVAAGGTAAQIGGEKTLGWSRTHSDFSKRFNDSGIGAGILAPNSTGGRQSGGVDLSLEHINWDEGNWPFLPIYGLMYGSPKAHSVEQSGRTGL